MAECSICIPPCRFLNLWTINYETFKCSRCRQPLPSPRSFPATSDRERFVDQCAHEKLFADRKRRGKRHQESWIETRAVSRSVYATVSEHEIQLARADDCCRFQKRFVVCAF